MQAPHGSIRPRSQFCLRMKVEKGLGHWTLRNGKGVERKRIHTVAGQGLGSVVDVVGLAEGVRCWTNDRDGAL